MDERAVQAGRDPYPFSDGASPEQVQVGQRNKCTCGMTHDVYLLGIGVAQNAVDGVTQFVGRSFDGGNAVQGAGQARTATTVVADKGLASIVWPLLGGVVPADLPANECPR